MNLINVFMTSAHTNYLIILLNIDESIQLFVKLRFKTSIRRILRGLKIMSRLLVKINQKTSHALAICIDTHDYSIHIFQID